MADVRLSVANGARVALRAQDSPSAVLSVGREIYDHSVREYEGAYEATPTWGEQEFATAGMKMAEDFTVHGILKQETSNEAGGLTLSI